MQLTAAHWVFLAGVVVILVAMVMRKNIVVPAVVATFLTALVYTGSLATGLSSVFNASLVAATSLFSIFLIIAMVTSMLRALEGLGADRRMVAPFRKVMRNGHLAWWTLVIVTYFISLFFWPTPRGPADRCRAGAGGHPGGAPAARRRIHGRHRRAGHGAVLRLRHPGRSGSVGHGRQRRPPSSPTAPSCCR